MKIFKFGGASVKDAAAVKNVADILKLYSGEKLAVVISAMGKTTNALEELHKARFHKQDYKPVLQQVKDYHFQMGEQLFGEDDEPLTAVYDLFEALEERLMSPCGNDFDLEYDQIVCYGELISTAMVNAYLQSQKMMSAWVDARQVIRTDARHRDARVDWNRSALGADVLKATLEKKDIVIIQGFIGSSHVGNTTTLGREGSDFTASIMAYLLDAESVTIWKDVPGMLNADPKWFKDTVKLDTISFHEAIELAYFGASVIHPKTIKPLQNKGIPLYIKSFVNPHAEGTVIQESVEHDNLIPSYIFKGDQVLVSVTPKDFSFVVEDNLRDIFDMLSSLGIRINMMDNSAISFSICVDKDEYKLEQLFTQLKHNYHIRYNENLTLMTIRHYDDKTVLMLTKDKEILLEHKSRHTLRLVMR
ncbi:MAG: aspartate kinase [Flavobacteriales bacterium]